MVGVREGGRWGLSYRGADARMERGREAKKRWWVDEEEERRRKGDGEAGIERA